VKIPKFAVKHVVFYNCFKRTLCLYQNICPSRLRNHDFVGSNELNHLGWASGGAGYLVRRTLLEQLGKESVPEQGAEDVLISGVLRRLTKKWLGTTALNRGLQNLPHPENSVASCHGCTSAAMRRIHAEAIGQNPEDQPLAILQARHAAWEGRLRFYRDGTFLGGGSNPNGAWKIGKDGREMELIWDHWPIDVLTYVSDGYRSASQQLTPLSETPEEVLTRFSAFKTAG
jgi:hypothetical protein